MDLDITLGSSPGLDVTMAPGSKQASHISLVPAFATSDLLLSTGDEPVCLFLCLPISHHTFAHHNGA